MKAMKLALAAALLLVASQASALIDISGFGGYTTLNMSDVNTAMDNASASIPGSTATHMTSGFYVGADAGFSVLPFLKVGPRLEYVQGGEASLNLGSAKETFDANLLLMEAGVTFDTSLPLTGLSVIGGIWGGYGAAGASKGISSGSTQDTAYGNGGGFVGEVDAQLRYKLTLGLSLGFDLGYRLANITNVNASSSNASFGLNQGDPLLKKFPSNDQANFDYSGLNIGGSINFDF